MEVVLRSDVEKVGKRGDIVTVADGYARNFLIARGHAIVATKGVAQQAKAMRAARDRADKKVREAAQATAAKIISAKIEIAARVGSEGKLFGSVTNVEIIEAIRQQLGVEVEKRQIELHEPIKSVGEHVVPIKLHSEVHVDATVLVQGEA